MWQDSKVEGQGGLREVTGVQMRNAMEVKEKRRWMGTKVKRSGPEQTTYLHQTAPVPAPETTSSFIIKHIWDGDTSVNR